MREHVLIGTNLAPGLDSLRFFRRFRLGDVVLTRLPFEKAEALAVARFCRENRIHLCFQELLRRGTFNLKGPAGSTMPREEFYSKEELEQVFDAAGGYYLGRFTVGEIGHVLYGPTAAYVPEWRGNIWAHLPRVRTMGEACRAYVEYVRRFLDYERNRLGRGPLLNVESGLVFKYHALAGIDVLCHEAMPSDPHLMHAAIRGTARAFAKPWGTHIAMHCYGGFHVDELWHRRWRTALRYAYISGADFIWSENDPRNYNQLNRQVFGPRSEAMKRYRFALREMHQFARIHTRPSEGPRVRLGVVHGNHDGTPGLWSRVVWGQHRGGKWLEGPPERGWRFADKFHRKEDWPTESVQGDRDFSGNPPFGQYDVVPIEAPFHVLKGYSCLVFLGWNMMTPETYDKLKRYVKSGGRLMMFLPHLTVEEDRAKEIRLYRNGDFRDLFGVKVTGRHRTAIRGIKCFADSSVRGYRFPRWRISTDPRFVGRFTPARLKVTSARILCGWTDHYRTPLEELLSRPVLTENRLGKGVAWLVTTWEYPADEGMARFTSDLLRTILQGEQGSIRLLASDRVRYSVYKGRAPGSGRRYSVIYLLNTDPDVEASVRLWVRGRLAPPLAVPANELRLVYLCGDALLSPRDMRTDLAEWKRPGGRDAFRIFSAAGQTTDVCTLHPAARRIRLNGRAVTCRPVEWAPVRVDRAVDPARREYFAPEFLAEPARRH